MAIYTLDSMQRALSIAQNNSNDGQRRQFSELFALMEDEEEEISSTTKRSQGRGRKPAASKPTTVSKRQVIREISDSSEESSEVC